MSGGFALLVALYLEHCPPSGMKLKSRFYANPKSASGQPCIIMHDL